MENLLYNAYQMIFFLENVFFQLNWDVFLMEFERIFKVDKFDEEREESILKGNQRESSPNWEMGSWKACRS